MSLDEEIVREEPIEPQDYEEPSFREKAKELLLENVVDSTGMLVAATPFYAAIEVFVSDMSVATSVESRLKIAGLSYVGLGFVYAKGRDVSRRVFNIEESTSQRNQVLHDAIYGVAFNIALSVPIYITSGADLIQTAIGTAVTSVFSLFSGPIIGYGIDTMRGLVEYRKPARIPQFIRSLRRKTKKTLAAGLIAASVAVTAGIYGAKKYVGSDTNAQVAHQTKYLGNYITSQ